MASFTEQATLRVIDESSKEIRKINAELKKLTATANAFGSKKFNLDVAAKGATAADAAIKKLTSDMKALAGAHVDLKVNVAGIAAAQSKLNSLRSSARKPIIQQIKHVAVGVLAGAGVRNVVHGVGHAAKEGYNEVDVSDYMNTMKRRTPAEQRATDAAIDQFMEDERKTRTGPVLSRAGASSIYSEIGGITQDPTKSIAENAKAASHLLTYTTQLTKMGVPSRGW